MEVRFFYSRPLRRSFASPPPFEPNVVGYPTTNADEKRRPMRASVAFWATSSSAISRRQTLARSPRPTPGPFLILLAQSERAGQACEAPDASSILAEDAITFG